MTSKSNAGTQVEFRFAIYFSYVLSYVLIRTPLCRDSTPNPHINQSAVQPPWLPPAIYFERYTRRRLFSLHHKARRDRDQRSCSIVRGLQCWRELQQHIFSATQGPRILL